MSLALRLDLKSLIAEKPSYHILKESLLFWLVTVAVKNSRRAYGIEKHYTILL